MDLKLSTWFTWTEIVIPPVEGDLAGTYSTSTTYKPNGAIATQSMGGWGGLPAETLTYDYTDTGLLDGLTGIDDYLDSVAYAWDGQITQTLHGTAGKQVRQSYAYDTATGRLGAQQIDTENQTNPGSWVDTFTTEFGYDHAGNITAIAGKTDGVRDQVECYEYDHLRRLTEAWTNSTWDCATAPVAGGAGADPYWRQWTFDTIGNRLTQTDKGVSQDTTWTYNVGAGNRVTAHQLATVDATGPLAQTGTRSFTYDPAGNMTSRTTEDGATQTLAWTADGHLDKVTEGSESTEYIYDADGNRLIQKAPDATTLYLRSTELEDSASGGPVLGTRYYAGYAVRSANGLKWTWADHHGTGQVQIDTATLNVNRQRSMPYGEERGTQAASWEGSKGYVGGTKDDTGLTHLGAREYDPTIGRFVSVDPIMDLTDPQQWHAYTYSNSNPTTYSDPSGKMYLIRELGGGGGGGPTVVVPLVVGASWTEIGINIMLPVVGILGAIQQVNVEPIDDADLVPGDRETVGEPEPISNKFPQTLEEELAVAEKLGVKAAVAGTEAFKELIESGERIKWAVLQDGTLVAIPHEVLGEEISHAVLSGGDDVLAAGEATVAGDAAIGYIGLEIINKSGHFQPSDSTLSIGVDAFGEAGVPFVEKTVEHYFGGRFFQ